MHIQNTQFKIILFRVASHLFQHLRHTALTSHALLGQVIDSVKHPVADTACTYLLLHRNTGEIRLSERIRGLDLKFLSDCDKFSRFRDGKGVISPPGVVKCRLSSAKAYLNYRLRRTLGTCVCLKRQKSSSRQEPHCTFVDSEWIAMDWNTMMRAQTGCFCIDFAISMRYASCRILQYFRGLGGRGDLKDFYVLL